MSFETRFSEDEQVLLSSLPSLIGTVMSMAEGSGIGTIKEMMSSAKSVLSGGTDFAGNELIGGVLPNVKDMKEAMAHSKDMREKMKQYLQKHEVKSKEGLRAQVIEDCAAANAILTAKSNEVEAEQYKKWILNVAENVSKSASEGGFLGFGGTQISQGEQSLFQEIASALQVQRTL